MPWWGWLIAGAALLASELLLIDAQFYLVFLGRPGGMEAMQLRVAEEYVKQFGKLADEASSTLIVPATLSDVSSMIALATSVVKNQSRVSGA